MPKFNEVAWNAYEISKYSIYTKSKDDRSRMKSSRVTVEEKSMYFSNSKDMNPMMASRSYFGSLRRFRRLIMLYSKCLYLNASRLTVTLVYKVIT